MNAEVKNHNKRKIQNKIEKRKKRCKRLCETLKTRNDKLTFMLTRIKW